MDAGAYSPAPSFENSFAAHEAAIVPLSFCRRIGFLSLFLTPEEIVELSHQFQGYQDAELFHLASSLRRQCMLLDLWRLPQ
jgi:hypothetical protein